VYFKLPKPDAQLLNTIFCNHNIKLIFNNIFLLKSISIKYNTFNFINLTNILHIKKTNKLCILNIIIYLFVTQKIKNLQLISI